MYLVKMKTILLNKRVDQDIKYVPLQHFVTKRLRHLEEMDIKSTQSIPFKQLSSKASTVS